MADNTAQLADLAELVMSVSRRLNAVVRADAQAVQLSSLERLVMRHIGLHPGTTPTQISNLFGMKSSNTSTALRSLERRGFVRREVDPDDGRAAHLYPTQSATDNLARVRAHWAQLLGPYVSSDAKLDGVVALLRELDLSLNLDTSMPRAVGATPVEGWA